MTGVCGEDDDARTTDTSEGFLASFLWRLVSGSVEKEVVVIADHTFTAHHAVIVVRRMAERSPFQFQVSMFTG